MRHILLLTILILLTALPLAAQGDDPLVTSIAPGETVEESITDRAFFDWWRIQLGAGDRLAVEMAPDGELEPLIGLLDPTGELIARSDINRPPQANTLALLDATVEIDGEYTIVATRAGNDQGTSTGDYRLTARIVARSTDTAGPEVEFRCDDMLITAALSFTFNETLRPETDPLAEFYRVTVLGLEDFMPIIRIEQPDEAGRLDCSGDAQRVAGSSFNLPDLPETSYTVDDQAQSAQLSLRSQRGPQGAPRFGSLRVTVGSLDGARGRYVIVLEGLRIDPRENRDRIELRLAPLARDTELRVYMLADADSRLDPSIIAADGDDVLAECDDAGRADCASQPELIDLGVIISGGCLPDEPDCDQPDNVYMGDRFDSAISLSPGDMRTIELSLGSREGRTTGAYTLIFVGELPE